ADQLLTLLPKRRRIGRIERIRPYAFADRRDILDVVLHRLRDMAVFGILSSDFVSTSRHTRPHRSRGALLETLPLQRPLAFGFQGFVDLLNALFDRSRIGVTRKLRLNNAWVHGGCTNSTPTMALVELHREENVCRFRTTVGDVWIVLRAFK